MSTEVLFTARKKNTTAWTIAIRVFALSYKHRIQTRCKYIAREYIQPS